ncbi:uncharacterized protein LOC130231551 isoform X2 [Danio aesculapii]|uniref:uncharacterized protein LOC130231551 isoform X2 n=1 Tax=Danio aesculapii TaxID=1142201 RepID=UPI0024BF4584|nr:uncharacterized protein LOC130231551 isoform X2 [Danio aesculapii]
MEKVKIDHHQRNSSDDSTASQRSINPPPYLDNAVNQDVVKRSGHDARLINLGPPAVYKLNTERKYIDGTDKKVRQWTYGRRDRNKQNKVILMVGETGTGKTTIINTMVNHLLGVKFEDQEFYQITEEEEQQADQTQSQTSEITVYEVFVEENPISLTIIDTPGYGDTRGHEKDAEIAEYLSRLFSDEDGVHDIDAVCFVMKASQNRLSGKELYIFHAVLSLFGKDIENNIVFLLSYSDGGPPADALNAIDKAEIPCRRDSRGKPVHFLFNNRQKEKREEEYEHMIRSAWEMGERSINKFFTIMEEKNRKSVQMTLDVMKERTRLDACVCNLKDRIIEKEQKNDELTQIQKALKENRDKIVKNENFQFKVNKVVKEKVPIVNEWWWNSNATCCSVCKENCHEWNCSWVSSNNLSWCHVMSNNHCTVCSGKCHYTKHVKENKKYVTKTEEVIMTFNELQQQYEDREQQPEISFDKKKYENTKKKHEEIMKGTEIEDELIKDLKKNKSEKSKLLQEAYMSIMRLSYIALKADSAFTLQHLDFLIPRLKEEEGKEEWVKKLEELKKAEEKQNNKGALRHLVDYSKQTWNQFFSRFTGKNE